ncbi:MAG TPA: late competence development ComFB family protein [Gemmatimonadales bacterium]
MIKNLVEDHVHHAYGQLRDHFPDFCGCDTCRADVYVYALNRLPARYVNTQVGAVITDFNLDKDQNRAPIDVAVMDAIRRVMLAPRCGRAAARP